jgi:broad specificity phosphatase PhoE
MSNLLLMRHGETDHNASDRFAGRIDVPLNAVGKRQARWAGLLLVRSAAVPDVTYGSPLQRARRSAELASDSMGLQVEPGRELAAHGASLRRPAGASQGRGVT